MLSAVPLAMVGLFNDMNSKFRNAASLESSVVFRWCIIYYTSFYNNKLLQILFALPGWIDWSVSDWHSIIKSLVYSDLVNHKSTDQVLSTSNSRAAALLGGRLLCTAGMMESLALQGGGEMIQCWWWEEGGGWFSVDGEKKVVRWFSSFDGEKKGGDSVSCWMCSHKTTTQKRIPTPSYPYL